LKKSLTNLINHYKIENKLISTVILTTILITGFLIIQPLHVQAQKGPVIKIPAATDPLDMNTITFKDIAKTVHVEKEIFKCITKNGAPVITMVSAFYRTI